MEQGKGSSFAGLLNAAGELPENQGQGANVDLPSGAMALGGFPIPADEPVVNDLAPPDSLADKGKKGIQGLPEYILTAHMERFVMGTVWEKQEQSEEAGGGYKNVPVERDDSAEYERIINMMLTGEAVRSWEERNVLKDGTVIVALCYLIKKDKPRKDASIAPTHTPPS